MSEKRELHESIEGCQSHACLIDPPKGQGTNGPCLCKEQMLKRYIRWLKFTRPANLCALELKELICGKDCDYKGDGIMLSWEEVDKLVKELAAFTEAQKARKG